MMFKRCIALTAMATTVFVADAQAQILDATSGQISVQARLTDANGDPLPDGPHRLDFFFYDGPSSAVAVASALNVGAITENGVTAVRLGPLSPTIFNGAAIWVGITVDDIDDNPVGDELSPRIPFGAVPYAHRVDRVQNEELTNHVDLGDATSAGSLRVFNGGTALPNVIIDGPYSTIELFNSLLVDHRVGVRIDGRTQEVVVNGDDGEPDAWLRSLPFGPESRGELRLYDATDNSRTVLVEANVSSGGALSLFNSNAALRSVLTAPDTGGVLTLHDGNGDANLTLNGDGATIDSLTTGLSLNAKSSEAVDIAAGGGNVAIGHSNAQSLLHLASLGGIDLIIDADTNNVGEDQNARLLLRQDGGQVVARVGFREGDNDLEIVQEFASSLILGTDDSDRVTITSSGNVGIGTDSPVYQLQVETGGLIGVYGQSAHPTGIGVFGQATSTNPVANFGVLGESDSPSGVGVRGFASADSGTNYAVRGQTDSPDGYAGYFTGPPGSRNYFQRGVGMGTSGPLSALHVVGAENDGANGAVRIASGTQTMLLDGNEIDSNSSVGLHLNNNVSHDVILVRGGGSVGIGTQTPGNYRLAVDGSIRSKEIVVETGWSDFVFKPGYELLSLERVEAHIGKHGHLPDIPSAEEVAAHGVKVGEMESKLLQKVEELTLHLIDMNKRLKLMEEENTRLRMAHGQRTRQGEVH